MNYLSNNQKRLSYPDFWGGRPTEYFEVIKETKRLYIIKVENYEEKFGDIVSKRNGTIHISKATGRELHPNSEENSCVIHANGRYRNEDGTTLLNELNEEFLK